MCLLGARSHICSTYLADTVLAVEPRTLCIRGKHSTNSTTSLAPFLYLFCVLLRMNIINRQIVSQCY